MNCRKEDPSFERLYTRYRPKGFILYRINTKESRETIKKFLEKHPMNFPILLDKTGKVGRLFGLWAHPATYLIDRQAMVRYRAVGPVDWTGAEAMGIIDQLLKERER
ncbi:MAG: TlpA family protein disulfide reductase [Deltaproteobacteria bacterium]|nr:TlpA family protein disulfide reductase [Deltaproteobacteria bacterium]